MDTDFTWAEGKTLGRGMGEIPETLYAQAGRLPGRALGGTLKRIHNRKSRTKRFGGKCSLSFNTQQYDNTK